VLGYGEDGICRVWCICTSTIPGGRIARGVVHIVWCICTAILHHGRVIDSENLADLARAHPLLCQASPVSVWKEPGRVDAIKIDGHAYVRGKVGFAHPADWAARGRQNG
jgi:hypothetical protein